MVERLRFEHGHSDARLNVYAGTIEQVIWAAVIGLWTDQSNRGQMQEDAQWVRIHARLQDLNLKFSVTQLMHPSKRS